MPSENPTNPAKSKRTVRFEVRLTPEEEALVVDAAARKGTPVRRYARECLLAVVLGKVSPAAWLLEAEEDLVEALAKIRGVADYHPPGWADDLEATMDDIIHGIGAAREGDAPALLADVVPA